VRRLSGGGSDARSRTVGDRNDLEQVAFAVWPVLGAFRDALIDSGASLALLSGSGSTVFGGFRDAKTRDRARDALGERFPGWRLIRSDPVAHGIRVRVVDRRD
jgi:4-diphosphocytidyl-2C-methyl-D-erythritol kinase